MKDSLWLSLIQEPSDFSLVLLSSTTKENSFISYKPSATVQAIKVCLSSLAKRWLGNIFGLIVSYRQYTES